ncbi:MAG: SufS family cysteine desulfurase [Deinococcus-Thermus bacterium]|jgi:cysteine desulfurase/selenocysteine lyase|nr:SufS family cysteine desulfurase [Deinococcota bacterium]
MTVLDPARLRDDFPILAREVHGKPLAYLDHAASSQKPRAVIDAVAHHYERHHANVHRGAHQLSAEATDAYEHARETVARFLGAPSPRSLVFVRNATEALNLLARAWGDAELRPGDEILVTVAEHHANLVPWQQAAQRTGARIRAVPLTAEQRLDMDALRAMLGPRTRVVAVGHMSNVLGVVHPVAEIAAAAREVGAITVVDGAQAAPHLPVDVAALGVDAYVVSGHKMLGPTGIGALWAREELLEAMPPFLGGGEMIRTVEIERSTYADIPMRFEAGTPAVAEAVGMAAAVHYLEAVGLERVWRHDRELATSMLDRLDALPGVTTFGPRGADRGGIVPFVVEGVHPHDVASALDAEGIAVRAGHHCAQPLMRALNVPSTVRASAYLTTTEEEIDRLVAAVASAREFFAAFA